MVKLNVKANKIKKKYALILLLPFIDFLILLLRVVVAFFCSIFVHLFACSLIFDLYMQLPPAMGWLVFLCERFEF